MSRPFCMTLACWLVTTTASACGGILMVGPGEAFTTIQSAIAAANPGDTVLVQAGNYNESLDFLGKAITVEAAPGAVPVVTGGAGAVVQFVNSEGSGSVLRGFVIQGGVAGFVSATARGAGISMMNASPTIEDCVIQNCQTVLAQFPPSPGASGGGMACLGNSAPVVRRCTIQDNTTNAGTDNFMASEQTGFPGGDGAGVFCDSGSAPTFIDCVIRRNTTGGGGTGTNNNFFGFEANGGRGGHGAGVFGPATLINCLIYGNVTGDGGDAGISAASSDNGPGGDGAGVHGAALVLHCTITDNHCGVGGTSPIASAGSTGQGAGVFDGTITNSIVWGNSPDQVAGAITATFSDIMQEVSGAGNINSDPFFVDPVNNDYHLSVVSTRFSPAINAADNSATMAAGVTADLDGNNRFDCGVADMGAYEAVTPQVTNGVWFVDAAAPFPGCGAEFGPFSQIQLALDAAQSGDIIHVAPGEYVECIDFNGKDVLVMSDGGAFATTIVGCAAPAGAAATVTFANGEGPGAVLSGFTVRGVTRRCLSIANASPQIVGCNLREGTSAADGGGIVCVGGAPRFDNCIVADNESNGAGGGAAFQATSPTLVNCTVAFNDGGGIDAVSSSLTIVNTIVWGNQPAQLTLDAVSSIDITHSNVQGDPFPHPTNLDVDPGFASLELLDLEPNSPLLNVGTAQVSGLSVVDVRQSFRVEEEPEIGAHEIHLLCGGAFFVPCTPGSGGNGSLIFALPGTAGDDLSLFTRVNGGGDPFADQKTAMPDDQVTLSILSASGQLAGQRALIAVSPYPTGFPPAGPANLNSVYLSPAFFVVLDSFDFNGFLGPTGLSSTAAIPPGTLGVSLRFQGFSIGPAAANGVYASTPAFDLDIVASNLPPVADAGADQVVMAGMPVSLDGSASSDPTNEPLIFQWTQVSGELVTLTAANTANATFTAPQIPGELVFVLSVSDGNSTDNDVVTITVTGS